MSRQDLSIQNRNKLMLSHQTIEGLKITVYSFIEVVPYLISLDGAKFVLSERFNQDSLEHFFGQQRSKCGRGDKPNVQQFVYNTQAIRTSISLVSGSSSNISGKRLFSEFDVDDFEPLRKRPRKES
jgi:hypothetical protein